MKKINLKNSKEKGKFRNYFFKFLFFNFMIFGSCFLTIKQLSKNNIDFKSRDYIDFFINKSFNKRTKYSFVVRESLKFVNGVDFKNPSTLIDKKFKIDNEKKERKLKKDATAADDDYNYSSYEKLTSFISNPSDNEVSNPIVYIYNTHQLETYFNDNSYTITPNIMMTSYLLSEKLNKKKINTIVEDTNINEFIKISNLNTNEPYEVSRIFINNAKNKYPSLKYFIDIHRDSVSKNISTTVINNKNYARVLFVLGTSNKTYTDNEKIMNDLDKISDDLYPGLSRGIFNRETKNWNLVYNQDLSPNAILIEVGSKENNMEEVLNTVDALSNILEKYLKG